MIVAANKRELPNYENGKPEHVYIGDVKIAGWHNATLSSATGDLTVAGTYNDKLSGLAVTGRSWQAQSVWGTNLITNGDFSNGITGWLGNRATADNGRAYFNATVSDGYLINLGLSTKLNATNVFYVSLDIETISGILYLFNSSAYGSYSGTGRRSWVGTISNPNQPILDDKTGSYFNGWVDNLIVLNLTAIFGAGHEPTSAQMDAMLAQYPNSWFDGKSLLTTDIVTYTPNSPSDAYESLLKFTSGYLHLPNGDVIAIPSTIRRGSVWDVLGGSILHPYKVVTGITGASLTVADGKDGGAWRCTQSPDSTISGTISGGVITFAAPVTNATVEYELAVPEEEATTAHAIPTTYKNMRIYVTDCDSNVLPEIEATLKVVDQ